MLWARATVPFSPCHGRPPSPYLAIKPAFLLVAHQLRRPARHETRWATVHLSTRGWRGRTPRGGGRVRRAANRAIAGVSFLTVLFTLLSTLPVTAAAAQSTISLETGAGRVITLDAPAANVFVADPKVAEVRPASPTTLFVFGVGPGRTSVAALDTAGHAVADLAVVVAASDFNATQAQTALGRLLPDTKIRVVQTTKGMLLTGTVARPADAARAIKIAQSFAPTGQDVTDELRVDGNVQVTLEVRIVEMSRSVTRALGIDWKALGSLGQIGKLPALNATLNGASAVTCASGPLLSVACLGLNVGAAINALATDGLAHVLAEPNLTVTSGEQASFLAGGEFPIPVGQQNGEVTIQFKSYGVQLAFVPTVLDDGLINLRVRPEVSQLSQQGAVQLTAGNSSISVPALTVRRAETTVDLGSGQTLAMAGLLQDSFTRTGSGLPGLRQLPVLGQLFSSDNYQQDKTELVILITPLVVQPVNDPSALHVPGDPAPIPKDRMIPLSSLGRPLPANVPADAAFILE